MRDQTLRRIFDGLCALGTLFLCRSIASLVFVSAIAESGGKEPNFAAAGVFLLNLAEGVFVAACIAGLAIWGRHSRLRLACAVWLFLEVLVFDRAFSMKMLELEWGVLLLCLLQGAVLLFGVALQRRMQPQAPAPDSTGAD